MDQAIAFGTIARACMSVNAPFSKLYSRFFPDLPRPLS
jgi:hypothetical protein